MTDRPLTDAVRALVDLRPYWYDRDAERGTRCRGCDARSRILTLPKHDPSGCPVGRAEALLTDFDMERGRQRATRMAEKAKMHRATRLDAPSEDDAFTKSVEAERLATNDAMTARAYLEAVLDAADNYAESGGVATEWADEDVVRAAREFVKPTRLSADSGTPESGKPPAKRDPYCYCGNHRGTSAPGASWECVDCRNAGCNHRKPVSLP